MVWCLPALAAGAVLVWGWPLASDGDLYLHLKTGERIAVEGWSLVDRFSYTSAGAPEETHSWLAQWLLWETHRLGGETGIRLWAFALVALVLCLVFRYVRARTGDGALAGLAAVLALVAHHQVQSFRPLLWGEAAFALMTLGILSAPLTRRRGWAAVGLTALWVNLHGSALLAVPLVASRAGRKWVWPGLAAIALLLNPRGWHLFSQAAAVTGTGTLLGVGEWLPPLGRSGTGIVVVALMGTAYALALRRRWETAAAAATVGLALLSHRHLAYLPFPLAVAAAELGPLPKWPRWAFAGLTAGVLALSGVHRSGRAVPPIEGMAAFLEDAGIEGNCFNWPGWGSYLVYRLHPKVKVAHTMRLGVHRNLFLWERDLWKEKGGISLGDVVARYPDTQMALLPVWWDLPKVLGQDWVVVFTNNEAALALRKIPANDANFARLETFRRKQATGWTFRYRERGGWGRWPRPSVVEASRHRTAGATRTGRFYWKRSG